MRVKGNSFRYLIYGAFGGNLITIKPGSAKNGSSWAKNGSLWEKETGRVPAGWWSVLALIMDGGAAAGGVKIQDRNLKIVWISFKIFQEIQPTDLLTTQCAVFVSNRDQRKQQLLNWGKFALETGSKKLFGGLSTVYLDFGWGDPPT